MWFVRLLVVMGIAGIAFAISYAVQLKQMRARREEEAARLGLGNALEALARPVDAALVAPFSGRPVIAYRIEILRRNSVSDDAEDGRETTLLYSETAGRVALERNGQGVGIFELGQGAILFPEPYLEEYPLPGITVATFSSETGGVRPPPHVLELTRQRGLGDELSASFLAGAHRLLFNERVIVPSMPLWVLGTPQPEPDGTLVYRGSVTWGLGSLAATAQINRREAARSAFGVALAVASVVLTIVSLLRR